MEVFHHCFSGWRNNSLYTIVFFGRNPIIPHVRGALISKDLLPLEEILPNKERLPFARKRDL